MLDGILEAILKPARSFRRLAADDPLGRGAFGVVLSVAILGGVAAGMRVEPWAVVAYALSPHLLIVTLLIALAALFPVQLSPVPAASDPEAQGAVLLGSSLLPFLLAPR